MCPYLAVSEPSFCFGWFYTFIDPHPVLQWESGSSQGCKKDTVVLGYQAASTVKQATAAKQYVFFSRAA